MFGVWAAKSMFLLPSSPAGLMGHSLSWWLTQALFHPRVWPR